MKSNQQTRLSVDGQQFTIRGKGAATGKIPVFDPPALAPAPHPLLEGSISDSVNVREALGPFYDSALKILIDLRAALDESKNAFADFKPEVANQKKLAHVAPHIEKFNKLIEERWKQAEKGLDYAQNLMAAARELAEPESEIGQLRNDLKASELRRYAEGMSQKARRDYINALVDAGDLFGLQALADIPLPLIDNDPHAIGRAIDKLTLDRFPWVFDIQRYNEEIAHAIRVRVPEIITIARRMLGLHGIELDKVLATLKPKKNPLSHDI